MFRGSTEIWEAIRIAQEISALCYRENVKMVALKSSEHKLPAKFH
tara:strand:+ start:55423 stop:55557 length:135 start_codon:yes stop_codon:yes gene_type:complete